MSKNFLDSTVIYMLSKSKIDEESKKNIMKQYITDSCDALTGKNSKNNCNITYDEKDLSKTNILSRMMKREVNNDEKYRILGIARKQARYSLANIKGEYKPSIMSRFVNLVTKSNVPTFPTLADQQKAAEEYNKLRDENRLDEIFDFRFSDETKWEGLTKDQSEELFDLYHSQKRQERNKDRFKGIHKVENKDGKIEKQAIENMGNKPKEKDDDDKILNIDEVDI